MLKKHEDFEKSLSAQEEKITVSSFLQLEGVQSQTSYIELLRKLFCYDIGYSSPYLSSLYIQALDEFATKLIQNNHYAKEDVATRRDAVSTSLKSDCTLKQLAILYFSQCELKK